MNQEGRNTGREWAEGNRRKETGKENRGKAGGGDDGGYFYWFVEGNFLNQESRNTRRERGEGNRGMEQGKGTGRKEQRERRGEEMMGGIFIGLLRGIF